MDATTIRRADLIREFGEGIGTGFWTRREADEHAQWLTEHGYGRHHVVTTTSPGSRRQLHWVRLIYNPHRRAA